MRLQCTKVAVLTYAHNYNMSVGNGVLALRLTPCGHITVPIVRYNSRSGYLLRGRPHEEQANAISLDNVFRL